MGGTANEVDPYKISWYDTAQQRNSVVVTIDQRLTSAITFFGEGFYTNHRFQFLNNANQSSSSQDLSVQVSTLNPYYPIGAPANLTVNYNMALEVSPLLSGNDVTDRHRAGCISICPPVGKGKFIIPRITAIRKATALPSIRLQCRRRSVGRFLPELHAEPARRLLPGPNPRQSHT